MWRDRPHFKRWYEQITLTPGYQQGLADWFNPQYLALMDSAGAEAWPQIMAILK
jgi:hypothetical protein